MNIALYIRYKNSNTLHMAVLTSAFTTMKASTEGFTLQSGVVVACNPKFSIRRHVAAGQVMTVTSRHAHVERRGALACTLFKTVIRVSPLALLPVTIFGFGRRHASWSIWPRTEPYV